jgi:hypothetical protein
MRIRSKSKLKFRRKLEVGIPGPQVFAVYINVCYQDQICGGPEVIKMWKAPGLQIVEARGKQKTKASGQTKCEGLGSKKM